jgi:hypothetical protein
VTIYKKDLERVYKLIEEPEASTHHVAARDAHGNVIHPKSQVATCWCVIGAFEKARVSNGWEIPTIALFPDADIKILSELGGGAAEFNDTHTHAEVLQLLKDAIERAPVRP